jgi:DNA-binding XRE family transcriptional regulator
MNYDREYERRLYVEVGKRLKGQRESLNGVGITQAKLAIAIGLERTSITNIESGSQRIPLHVFIAICAALECAPSSMLPIVDDVISSDLNSEVVRYGSEETLVTPKAQQLIQKLANELNTTHATH